MTKPRSERWKVFYAFPTWYAHSPGLEQVASFGTLTEAHTWATGQATSDADNYNAPEAWGTEA